MKMEKMEMECACSFKSTYLTC